MRKVRRRDALHCITKPQDCVSTARAIAWPTVGLVDTVSIPTLLKMVASGRIPAEKMGTHSFTFGQMDEAYDVFKNAAANSALKVVITPS